MHAYIVLLLLVSLEPPFILQHVGTRVRQVDRSQYARRDLDETAAARQRGWGHATNIQTSMLGAVRSPIYSN